jgi:hypothetical protein
MILLVGIMCVNVSDERKEDPRDSVLFTMCEGQSELSSFESRGSERYIGPRLYKCSVVQTAQKHVCGEFCGQ